MKNFIIFRRILNLFLISKFLSKMADQINNSLHIQKNDDQFWWKNICYKFRIAHLTSFKFILSYHTLHTHKIISSIKSDNILMNMSSEWKNPSINIDNRQFCVNKEIMSGKHLHEETKMRSFYTIKKLSNLKVVNKNKNEQSFHQ